MQKQGVWHSLEVQRPKWDSDEFIGLLGHEVNNLISSCRGYLELARMDSGAHDVSAYVTEAIGGLDRLVLFNNSLLAMAGRLNVLRKPVSVSQVIVALKDLVEIHGPTSTNDALEVDLTWFVRIHEILISTARQGQWEYAAEVDVGNNIWEFKFVIKKYSQPVDWKRVFQPFYISRSLQIGKGLGWAFWPGAVETMGGIWRLEKHGTDNIIRLRAQFPVVNTR